MPRSGRGFRKEPMADKAIAIGHCQNNLSSIEPSAMANKWNQRIIQDLNQVNWKATWCRLVDIINVLIYYSKRPYNVNTLKSSWWRWCRLYRTWRINMIQESSLSSGSLSITAPRRGRHFSFSVIFRFMNINNKNYTKKFSRPCNCSFFLLLLLRNIVWGANLAIV